MRVLFVAKRHPQQRDLIERPYGRFHYLPTSLAAMGHEVHVFLCSHRHLPSVDLVRDDVHWISHDLRTLGIRKLWQRARSQAEVVRPDWIIGMSDAWYGWLAQELSRRTDARLAVDAYDNYEAYMPWNLPLHWQWRRSIAMADVVTAAGPQLATLLDKHRPGKASTSIVPMAADPSFIPHDRLASRSILGLPPDAPLIGYSGSWTGNRGTDCLLDVFRKVRGQYPEARLVLTGRPPAHALTEFGVIALGYLPDAQLPLALSALDVACVMTADTTFGRYSYPAKLSEAMACRVPVVASDTDAVRWMLGGREHHLAQLGGSEHFTQQILAQLDNPRSDYGTCYEWSDSARCLEALLLQQPRMHAPSPHRRPDYPE